MNPLEKEHADTLAAVMIWAVEHYIEVRVYPQIDYGGHAYPMIRFSKNDKNIEMGLYQFWPEKLKHIWKDVGMKLCVEAPRFKDGSNEPE